MIVTVKYIKKPVEVTAMQFNGWSNAYAIFSWAGKGFFVPTGAEHPLRSDNEKDGSTDNVIPTAPAFFVIPTSNGNLRVNIGNWIVMDVDEKLEWLTPEEFEEIYQIPA